MMNNLIELLFNNQPDDRLAVVHGNETITYGQLRTKTKQAVTFFSNQGKNLRVGIHCQDSIAWIVALLGAMASGNLVASIPSRGDAQQKIKEFSPDILLTDLDIDDWYQQLDLLPTAQLVSIDIDQPCLLLNSGGTTRSSRFIMHSTASMKHKLALAHRTLLDQHSDGQSVLVVAPLFSSYGTVNMLMTLQASATLIIMKNLRPDYLVGLIDQYHINYFGATPAIYSLMLKHQLIPRHHPRRCIVVGDFVTRHLMQRWHMQTGYQLIHGFGTSEAGMIFIADEHTPMGALGRPTVDIQLRQGQLWINSASNMIGIWPIVSRQQWVYTGDVLRYDNGEYYFVGRSSETFKVDGKDVDIAWIEQTVLDSGLVEDLVAVPAYDQEDRAHIKLLVVGDSLERSKLENYLQECKVKAYIEQVDSIPRSPAGKKIRIPCYL